MKRYWLANSSDTPPSPPSSTVGGYPQDGNIALNHKPTKVGAWWYHMITEEFMAVIERAGLTPSHENLHQLADIFDDFKQRAQGAETFKDQAVAAADRAEAAATQVVTDVEGAIAQVQAETDAEIARLNTRAGEVEASTSNGLTNLQNKLTELIARLEQVGGEQAAYVISQAQEILDSTIPPQTGSAGYLKTNGTSTSWSDEPLEKSGGTMTGVIEFAEGQTIAGYEKTVEIHKDTDENKLSYVKFDNGLVFCFGQFRTTSASAAGVNLTFPTVLSGLFSISATLWASGARYGVVVNSPTTAGCTIGAFDSSGAWKSGYAGWVTVIGFWK